MSDNSVVIIPWPDGSGVEIQFHDGAGYIMVPNDSGEAYFPHGDGFSFIMAGDDTRVEAEDGTVLWHSKSLREGDPS